jgi:hypothetical protein
MKTIATVRHAGMLALAWLGGCSQEQEPPIIDECALNLRCRLVAPGGPDAGSDQGDGPAPLADSGPPRDVAPDRPGDAGGPDRGPDMLEPPGSMPCPADDPSLMLCLRFENNLVDDSAPAATVTASGVSYEPGPTDQAVRLTDSSLVRADPGWGGNLDLEFTLEAWIRPERLPLDVQRFGIFDEETHFALFLLPDGGIRCSSSGAAVVAPNAVTAGLWAAVSCTASNNALVLWVDGVKQGEAQMDGNANGSTFVLGIGGNLPSGDAFEGLIDNVRVWARARTPEEVCAFVPGCVSPP